MFLVVYVSGWGAGEGSHVSLFLYLLQGEYDDNLLWPFQGYITLQLVNQKQDSLHKQVTISCLDYTADRVRNKPRLLKGFPKFISHDDLSNEQENTHYVKNDSLEFHVIDINCKTHVGWLYE